MEVERNDWFTKAVCRGVNPEIFFPVEVNEARDAKIICGECPVKTECLEYALTNKEEYGVWGGATFRERKIMLKKRRREMNNLNLLTSSVELNQAV